MELKDLIKKYRSIKADPNWVKESHAHFLAYFSEKFPYQRQEKARFFIFKPVFAFIMIVMVILFSGSGLVLKAAGKSLPGESLYFVKRVSEKIIFKITSAKQKPALRAEMVQERLSESRRLVIKGGTIDSKPSPQLTKAVQEFKKEFVALKKEIGFQTKEEILTSPDLPIQDNKKIIKLVQNLDLEKLLKETKEALTENKVEIALEKTLEMEKIISPIEEEKEEPTETPQEEKPETETLKKLPATGSISEIKPLETKPIDFKVDLLQESNSFKTDLLRE